MTEQQQPTNNSSSSSHDEEKNTNEYIRLTEYGHTQIEWAWKNFKWFSGLIGVIITLFAAIFSFLFWNNLSGFKTETNNDLTQFKDRLSKEVQLKIDKQFDEQNISSLVISAAQERVDAIARPVIQSNIEVITRTDITPLKADVSILRRNHSALEDKLIRDTSRANIQYSNISNDIGTLRLFFNAKLGDSSSLRTLDAISASESASSGLANTLRFELDAQYTDFIQAQSRDDGIKRRIVSMPSMKPYRPDEITLLNVITSDPNPYQRQAAVNHIADHNYLHFVEDLARVVHSDSNIYVRCCAVVALQRLTGKTFSSRPLFDDVAQWWDNEGHTNQAYLSPFPSIRRAEQLFNDNKFDEALSIFQQATTNRAGFPHSHLLMGVIYHNFKHDSVNAKKEYEKAMSEADLQVAAVINYANILYGENDKDRAIAALKTLKPYFLDFSEAIIKEDRLKSIRDDPGFKAMLNEK